MTNREPPYHAPARRPTIVGDRSIYFYSKEEANYAFYLEFLKVNELIENWRYQPCHFDLAPSRFYPNAYIPDFQVLEVDGRSFFIEITNALTPHFVSAMRREHPAVEIKVISPDDYKTLELNSRIPGWRY